MSQLPPFRRAYQQSGLKLNIGPGKNFKRRGWVTLDHYLPHSDLKVDLRECPRIPLPSSSTEKVFCSHVIEHIDDRAVESLFRECHRVLRADGILRISCPDVSKAIQQHRDGMSDPDAEVLTSTMKAAPSHLRLLNVIASFRAPSYCGITNTRDGREYSGGPIADADLVEKNLNSLDLPSFTKWVHSLIPDDATYRAHINAFWPERVVDLLKQAGFQEVRISSYRESKNDELREEDFDNRPGISLFVEARPGGTLKAITGSLLRYPRSLRRAFELWK